MKFWWVLGILILVIGGGSFFVLSSFHGGNDFNEKIALEKTLGHAPILTPTDHSSWNTYQSQVISFSYPGWAKIYTEDNKEAKNQPNILDSFHFTLSDSHINGMVSVINRPMSTHITDEPAVQLRQNNKDYEMVGTTSQTNVQFMNKITGEQSAFLLQRGKVVSIVITGGKEEVRQDTFNRIYRSFSLK